jgi:hypothetical protein
VRIAGLPAGRRIHEIDVAVDQRGKRRLVAVGGVAAEQFGVGRRHVSGVNGRPPAKRTKIYATAAGRAGDRS